MYICMHMYICMYVYITRVPKLNQSPKTQLNRPTLTRTKANICFQEPTSVGQLAGFLLQNSRHPTRPMLYKKSNQIRQDQARSGEILTKFNQISTRSGGI